MFEDNMEQIAKILCDEITRLKDENKQLKEQLRLAELKSATTVTAISNRTSNNFRVCNRCSSIPCQC